MVTVEAFEAEVQRQQLDLAALRGKLAVCQELLDPAQAEAEGVRQSLEALSEAIAKLQEVNDYQLQSIAELASNRAHRCGSHAPDGGLLVLQSAL